jgi:hypothetical protein
MLLDDERILSIGMISLAMGILIGRFLHFEYAGFAVTDFVEGVLIGLSLAMNLAYMIRKRKNRMNTFSLYKHSKGADKS